MRNSGFTFFFFFFLVVALFPTNFCITSLFPNESLSANQTLVSGKYEFGCLKMGRSFFLGLWYRSHPQKTFLWVANRDAPMNSSGILKFSGNRLVLEQEQGGKEVWSTTVSKGAPVVAELLMDGNFVLRDIQRKTVWQSFDFPTDTLLPGMKLGGNRSLISWRTSNDPSVGLYSLRLEESGGLPELLLCYRDSTIYRASLWNEVGVPEMHLETFKTARYSNRSSDIRLTVSYKGLLQQFRWNQAAQDWDRFWFEPEVQCDEYNECGSYGYCDQTTPICNCIRGFKPKDVKNWNQKDGWDGCVRNTNLSCHTDGFLKLSMVKLPGSSSAISIKGMGFDHCRDYCLKDCKCQAFAVTSRFGCVSWKGRLRDMRRHPQGQDIYFRLAASDLRLIGEEKKASTLITGLTVLISIVLLLIILMIFFSCLEMKHKPTRAIVEPSVNLVGMENVVITNRMHLSVEHETEDFESPLMDLTAVSMATDNFSDLNKIGTGGSGVVYRGRLLDGQQIAVKKLSKNSPQGAEEFLNEVRLISNLQHNNLVRLLGCCVDASEKMLVYEYLENGSLDSFLFDQSQSCQLNWQTRFDIINGIARGILYLHQDSRLRIVHRDLKASNVLLDKDMTPKIADFGMARIFARDETEANTSTLAGTFGYMSPEYGKYGIISTKSDVYSFGVMVLEILSGKKNTSFGDSEQDLPGHVWNDWKDGKGLESIDPLIRDFLSTSPSHEQQVLRCIQVGLVCVQDDALDRPTMSLVVMMLEGETVAIPQPKKPGFYVTRSPRGTDLESGTEATISEIEPL